MKVVSKYIDVLGLRTHYLEAGSGDPVVLVHGGGAGADATGNWTATIAEFASRYHVFALDMIGFGKTEVPAGADYVYSQENRDAHLAAFIESLRVGPVHLVGNSMGGLTSLGASLLQPSLCRKLVLMGSAGIRMKPSPELLAIVKYDFTMDGMAKIVDGLTGPDFVPAEGLVEYRYNLTTSTEARRAYEGIIAWQHSNGGLWTPEERIASVSAPTLVVSGKNDLVVPITSAYRFLELIPHSWGVVMPRCGHWPMIEYPVEFSRIVNNFLQ